MKSVGALLAGDDEASGALQKPTEVRLHRVTLSVMIFAEIEVLAPDRVTARDLAVASATHARRKFSTAPVAHRVEVQEPVNPREYDGPRHWVEVTS